MDLNGRAVTADTRLGQLGVRVVGAGAPAVFWHSLFVDSSTWERVQGQLMENRTLIMIDGPSHGSSAPRTEPFTLEDCAAAALDVLGQLDIDDAVDWVGNAWGGHVGLVLAAAHPHRCRSLVTIGTPVHDLSRAERLRLGALVGIYRLTGPISPLVKAVSDALLGSASAHDDADAARRVTTAFRRAERRGMYQAMRSVMLARPDLTDRLATITTPALFVAGMDDPLWTEGQARAATAHLPCAAAVALPGAHLGPLFGGAPQLAELVSQFWNDPGGAVKEYAQF